MKKVLRLNVVNITIAAYGLAVAFLFFGTIIKDSIVYLWLSAISRSLLFVFSPLFLLGEVYLLLYCSRRNLLSDKMIHGAGASATSFIIAFMFYQAFGT